MPRARDFGDGIVPKTSTRLSSSAQGGRVWSTRSSMDDRHLAGFHCGQCVVVALWRDAGAEGGVEVNRDVWQRCFQEHGVGDDADICADADEGDRCEWAFDVCVFDGAHELGGAEGWFFKTGGVLHFQRAGNGFVQGPAVGAFQAVHDGQIMAFLGLEIIVAVGVESIKNGAVVAADALGDGVNNGCCFFGAEGAIDEIVLHVDDDEQIVGGEHGRFPP